MKVLLLTRYGRRGASSRIRMLQYLPYLEARGVRVTVSPLFTDEYLRRYYESGRKPMAQVAASYLRRGARLLAAGGYDLLWIEKELFPFLPPCWESLLRLAGKRYVVDYDDAVFHTYDCHRSSAVRSLLGGKIDGVMRRAALVVAGNGYLAERGRRAGSPRVEILPSVVDAERYRVAPPRAGEPFTIGWIGSPSIAYYLAAVRSPLAALCRESARVVLVGAGKGSLPGLSAELRPWSEETEVAEIQRFDVGIMPLPDTPWERGKCGFKLIQYMACGIPVVASPVGVNAEIVAEGVNGFLATGEEQWASALRMLRDDPGLRRRMGEAGRARVEAAYSLQVAAPRLFDLLTEAAGN